MFPWSPPPPTLPPPTHIRFSEMRDAAQRAKRRPSHEMQNPWVPPGQSSMLGVLKDMPQGQQMLDLFTPQAQDRFFATSVARLPEDQFNQLTGGGYAAFFQPAGAGDRGPVVRRGIGTNEKFQLDPWTLAHEGLHRNDVPVDSNSPEHSSWQFIKDLQAESRVNPDLHDRLAETPLKWVLTGEVPVNATHGSPIEIYAYLPALYGWDTAAIPDSIRPYYEGVLNFGPVLPPPQ